MDCIFAGTGNKNTVNIADGTYWQLRGAVGDAVEGNTLKMTGGTATTAYGGESNNGTTKGNTVDISGNAYVSTNVIGGYGRNNGEVSKNHVRVSGDAQVGKNSNYYINGGRSANGNIKSNDVTINGGIVIGTVAGGFANGGGYAVTDNEVIVDDGTIEGAIYGGRSSSGEAISNTVTISGGTFNRGDGISTLIAGGYSVSGAAEKNGVSISGGAVGVEVYGGYGVGDGDTNSNYVTISGGQINTNVRGGRGDGSGTVNNNTVKISGDTTTLGDKFSVYGGYGYGSGVVEGNQVSISDGVTINSSVYGGYSTKTTVSGNTISISNSQASDVNDTADPQITGGRSGTGKVEKNQVTLSGGTIGVDTYGGYTSSSSGKGGDVSNNEVSIEDGTTITKNVYGGYSSSTGKNIEAGAVSGNTVSISAETNFNSGVSIYGGYSKTSMGGTAGNVTNNTINVSGEVNLSGVNLYGANTTSSEDRKNQLVLNGWAGTVQKVNNFDSIKFQNIDLSKKEINLLTLGSDANAASGAENAEIFIDSVAAGKGPDGSALAAGDYKEGSKEVLSTLTWDKRLAGNVTVAKDLLDGIETGGKAHFAFRSDASDGVYANTFGNLSTTIGQNKVDIEAEVTNSVLAGTYVDADGKETYHSSG